LVTPLLATERKRRPGSLVQIPETLPAAPFLKWAGGKSRLLKTFDRYFPKNFKRYFEPFLGGGAVFFHLANKNRNLTAFVSDLNPELINCYEMVRDNKQALIASLKKHRNDKHHFYKIRSQDPKGLLPAQRASRLIFLNKTCFNGLYRVNSKGNFNVPFGKYKSPKIIDEPNLTACSRILNRATISCEPFDQIFFKARLEDFIYLDPPYQPISATSNFTGYTKGAFTLEDQKRLSELFRALSRRGCYLMLSNSDTPEIRALYKGFRFETVQASRAINCNGRRRGRINELLILNY
jgi:DNA adenine methylase